MEATVVKMIQVEHNERSSLSVDNVRYALDSTSEQYVDGCEYNYNSWPVSHTITVCCR